MRYDRKLSPIDVIPSLASPDFNGTAQKQPVQPCIGHMDPGGWYHWHAATVTTHVVIVPTKVMARRAAAPEKTRPRDIVMGTRSPAVGAGTGPEKQAGG